METTTRTLALFLCSLLSLYAAKATQQAALVGTTVTFSCPLQEGKTEDQVQKWIKGRDTIFEDEGMVLGEKWNQDKFDLAVGSVSEYNLTINKLTMSDKDTYVCLLHDMETEKNVFLKEYDLVVLEKPHCAGETKLVNGETYEYICSSDVNDVTLLWSVGTGEKNVGANLVDEADVEVVYKTKKSITADSSLKGKSVECELQHPSWSVQDGALQCSLGPLVVESEVQITCDENDQKGDGIACVISARDSSVIEKENIGWMVRSDPSKVTPVDPTMIETLADGSGYRVTLNTPNSGEMHALKVGDVEGPWQKMPSTNGGGKEAGSPVGMIVVIVVIVVLLVVIVVLFVLYKRKVIFSTSEAKATDMEKGAPKLNGVTHNGDGKTLLDNKDMSNVDDEKRRDSNEDCKNNLIIDTKPQKMEKDDRI